MHVHKIYGLLFYLLVFFSPEFAWAKHYIITIQSAKIAPTDSNKRKWDFGWKKQQFPDVYVELKVGKKTLKTTVISNTLTPTWKMGRVFQLQGDEWLSIRIMDKDFRKDDLIGQIKISVARLLQKKSFSFAQVISLGITLEEVQPVLTKKKVTTVIAPTKAK